MATLAIDQGTTSTRAVRVDDSGNRALIRVESHRQFYPRAGWVEHDPEELIKNITRCIDHCQDIAAIGIDNQGESCLAWDAKTGQAVSPVIVWQDDRTRADVEALKSRGMEPLILERAGLPLDSYFSAAKLGWIMKHIPEAPRLHSQGRLRLGTTDAFFLDRLTGRFATDISTASRTCLMNLATGTWDDTLCDLFEVPMDALPDILPTTADFGNIVSKGRAHPDNGQCGGSAGRPFTDTAPETPGMPKITFGTGAFALVVTGSTPLQSPEKGLLPTVAWKLGENKTIFALDGGVFFSRVRRELGQNPWACSPIMTRSMPLTPRLPSHGIWYLFRPCPVWAVPTGKGPLRACGWGFPWIPAPWT